MSLVNFDYSLLGTSSADNQHLDLLPVLHKEKLLLVEEDPDISTRELVLDMRGQPVSAERLKLVITHQILVPMTIIVSLRIFLDTTHTVELTYNQEVMARDVNSTVRVKGVVCDDADLICDSQMIVRGDHQGVALRTEKKFTLVGHGRVSSRPQLTALKRGMRASHGLTISGLDDRQLYFMTSRGLPSPWAKELLLSV